MEDFIEEIIFNKNMEELEKRLKTNHSYFEYKQYKNIIEKYIRYGQKSELEELIKCYVFPEIIGLVVSFRRKYFYEVFQFKTSDSPVIKEV